MNLYELKRELCRINDSRLKEIEMIFQKGQLKIINYDARINLERLNGIVGLLNSDIDDFLTEEKYEITQTNIQ